MTLINTTIQKHIVSALNTICSHPFLKELSDGTLDKKTYEYYLLQDNIYLHAYSKVLTDLANLAENKMDRNFLLQCANQTSQELAAVKYKDKPISFSVQEQ